ncbi:MAG: glycosyltransferase family A protein [Halioglobus sp.]
MTTPSNTARRNVEPVQFSIVVNNYNYARYLPEALDNALSQMRARDELIVVDDGSTDDSMQLLRQYEHEHGVRVFQQENSGQMRTVRTGMRVARGDVIVLLDSDDYFLEGYLDRLRAIYAQHPDVSFTFSRAQLSGDAEKARKSMQTMLNRLQLPAGKVGPTKWAALLFNEFVGVPTSGISLHRSLAEQINALPSTTELTTVISPLVSKVLGISTTEQKKSGYTADGVIVRCASILGAIKYYDDHPGFMYRIHGANKYANASRLARVHLLRLRKKQFVKMVREHYSIVERPTAVELREEILSRVFGVHLRRRIAIRGRYCRAILSSEGSLREKISALTAALGLQRRIT